MEGFFKNGEGSDCKMEQRDEGRGGGVILPGLQHGENLEGRWKRKVMPVQGRAFPETAELGGKESQDRRGLWKPSGPRYQWLRNSSERENKPTPTFNNSCNEIPPCPFCIITPTSPTLKT